MIDVDVPGFGRLSLSELVCDFNGTLACDGRLLDDARVLLPRVASLVNVRVVTGDTFGSARKALHDYLCEVRLLGALDQARAKADFVAEIGAERVVAIGNGRNDRLMLEAAALHRGDRRRRHRRRGCERIRHRHAPHPRCAPAIARAATPRGVVTRLIASATAGDGRNLPLPRDPNTMMPGRWHSPVRTSDPCHGVGFREPLQG
jgi:soluble P-type ATPase